MSMEEEKSQMQEAENTCESTSDTLATYHDNAIANISSRENWKQKRKPRRFCYIDGVKWYIDWDELARLQKQPEYFRELEIVNQIINKKREENDDSLAADSGCDTPKKNYKNGFPVQAKSKTPVQLMDEYFDETIWLRVARRERAEKDGIFLDGFGIVTAMVFMDYDLRIWDKLVFAALKLFAGADGHTRVKQQTICGATMLGRQAVQRAIKNLVQHGYVQCVTTHEKSGKRARNEYICFDNPRGLGGDGPLKGKYRGKLLEYKLPFKQWGRVSKAVFCDESLDKYAKLVYVALCVLGCGRLFFTGTNAHISALIGNISRGCLQKALKQLENHDYIIIYHVLHQSKYVINMKPEQIPYPEMFYCNDITKVLKKDSNQNEERIADISSVTGTDASVEKIVTEIIKSQESELPELRKRKLVRGVSGDFALQDSEDNILGNDYELYEDYFDAAKKTKKIPEKLEKFLNDCKTEDTKHPEMDYGRKYHRKVDLTAPENEFQCVLSRLHQLLYTATDDEKVLAKLVVNEGIPVEYARKENKEQLLRCIDFLVDAVPGIHTTIGNKCLQQIIDILRSIVLRTHVYKINGEPVSMLDFILSFNNVLTVDDGGVSMAGFLQQVAKHAAKRRLCGDVQNFKTGIVHMMESTCRARRKLEPVLETQSDYSQFKTHTRAVWHSGRSCWAEGDSSKELSD